jgi:hypothetical protein
MAVEWTIEVVGGNQQTVDAWGLAEPVLSFLNQAPDTLAVSAAGRDVDAAHVFAYGSTIKLHRKVYTDAEVPVLVEDQVYFVGRVIELPDGGDAAGENQRVVAAGPWWYLDNLVFQQTWTISDLLGGTTSIRKSRLILFVDHLGVAKTVKSQIEEIFDYVLEVAGAPAPFQYAVDDGLAFTAPFDPVQDVTCAEAVRRCLRWAPDACTWLDYSTTPPTLHVAPRSALAAKSVACGSEVDSVELRARNDLQVPQVVLKFEQTTTIDGVTWENVTLDVWPEASTGEAFGAMLATVNLKGFTASYLSQKVVTADLPADLNDLDWWKKKKPELAVDAVTNLTITGAVRVVDDPLDEVNLPRELVQGGIADWMTKDASQETWTAKASYTHTVSGTNPLVTVVKEQPITVRLIATDATTKTYKKLDAFSPGEPVPTGLAQKLYAALNTLHHEGQISLLYSEVNAPVRVGNVLHVTGGRAAWATMAAQVQQVTESLETGQVQIAVGPPPHLSAGDLVELLRVNRHRMFSGGDWQLRVSGQQVQGGEQELPHKTRVENSSASAPGGFEKIVLVNGAQMVTLDPAAIAPQLHAMFREVDVCENGVAKKAKILMTETYTA